MYCTSKQGTKTKKHVGSRVVERMARKGFKERVFRVEGSKKVQRDFTCTCTGSDTPNENEEIKA